MKKIVYGCLLLLLILAGSGLGAIAQVSVTGPVCVVPGLTYQYSISGKWDSASVMQICLTGGKIAGSAGTCTANGKPNSYVRVIWDSVSSGSVGVTSSAGNTNLSVNVSQTLQGGLLQATSATQVILYNSLPDTLHCSAASGGACSPQLHYQWQQSDDRSLWTNITGATAQNYTVPAALLKTQYYRRVVKDDASGTIAYSDIAMIAVTPLTPTTSN